MKAFVIKFSNEYYWCGYNNSDKQLRKAVLYKSIKMAEETARDCMSRIEYIRPYTNKIESYKIIEITIAEGDLEQQLAEKDKEIEKLKNENKQLKEQPTEKDKKVDIDSFVKEFENRRCFIVDDIESNFSVVSTHMYMFNDDEIKEHAKTLITIIDHWCIIDVDYGALSVIDDKIERLNEYRNIIKKEMESEK